MTLFFGAIHFMKQTPYVMLRNEASLRSVTNFNSKCGLNVASLRRSNVSCLDVTRLRECKLFHFIKLPAYVMLRNEASLRNVINCNSKC